jgi:hypothetical protein
MRRRRYMGIPDVGNEFISAFLTVALTLLWGLSVALVYFHASTHERSTWLWVLIALIPGIGFISYFLYFYYKNRSTMVLALKRRKERIGNLIAKPRTAEQRETHEAIAALAKFRDQEIEKLIIDGEIDEAKVVMETRRQAASMNNDFIAMESYDIYWRAADKVEKTSDLPRILKKLYNIKDEEKEKKEPQLGEPAAEQPGLGAGVCENVVEEEKEEPNVFKDEQSWLEFGD